ncbi:unnamed protein product [Bemisia tabaci]|uniref:Uncharacterized protein n=1 Tax=Bemisia tabaci TaxID=7038 RepID=A0A9P0F2S6_BEMTA|nr:unnamed protein product [Bemisia tabaci]
MYPGLSVTSCHWILVMQIIRTACRPVLPAMTKIDMMGSISEESQKSAEVSMERPTYIIRKSPDGFSGESEQNTMNGFGNGNPSSYTESHALKRRQAIAVVKSSWKGQKAFRAVAKAGAEWVGAAASGIRKVANALRPKNVKKFLKPKKNKKKGSKGGGFFHRGNKDKSPPA